MLCYCSSCKRSTRNSELSRFRSARAFAKQAICFVGRERRKAFGSMGVIAMLRRPSTQKMVLQLIESTSAIRLR